MRSLLAAVLTAVLAGAATAAPIFSDNFNAQNGGTPALNFTGFSGWTVSGGTVDLIGNGSFDFLPGNGLYVDLDGSTNQAGLFSTNTTFGPGTYALTFRLAGSQRGDTNTVTVNFGDWTTTISNIPSGQPFTTFSFLATTTTTGSLSFKNNGGDNIGALLDNVTVSTVPEPLSLVVFGGLVVGGVVVARRRLAAKG